MGGKQRKAHFQQKRLRVPGSFLCAVEQPGVGGVEHFQLASHVQVGAVEYFGHALDFKLVKVGSLAHHGEAAAYVIERRV